MIAAEGEQKASAALREAADVIATSQSAIQLRYLQVYETHVKAFEHPVNRVHLFADAQLHFGGEELNDHFPHSNRHHQQIYEEENVAYLIDTRKNLNSF